MTSTQTCKVLLTGMLIFSLFPEAGRAKQTNHNDTINHDAYAFIDKRGKIVFRTPPDAESENFSDGVLKIKTKTKNDEPDSSFMNKHGKVIAEGFIHGGRFSEGLAEVGKRGEIGFIDKTGKVATAKVFSDALCFREGRAPVMVNKGFGFIDRTGSIVIAPFFENATGFSDGLAAVQSQGEIGFIDKTGKWRIKPRFRYVDGFSDGLALVVENNEEFYIDHDGRKVISLDDEQRKRPFIPWGVSETGLSSGNSFFQGFNSRTFRSPCTFCAGLSPMYKDKQYGYISKSGEFVIHPQFQQAFPFVEGLARVCVDNKWGFINRSGAFVVEPKYSRAEDFSDGAAAVATGHNKWGHIDTRGRFISNARYISAGPFHCGRARVQLTGCYDDHIDDKE